jgi:hypothetical protein
MEELKKLYLKANQHLWFKVALGVLVALIAYSLIGWIWVALVVTLIVLGLNQVLSKHGGIIGVAKKTGQVAKKLGDDIEQELKK